MEQTTRRERKKRQTETHIVNTAMSLFSQNGVDNTTMEQIADLADVSKATLYKYFPVKEAIIAVYWQYQTEEHSRQLEQLLDQHQDTRSRLKALFLKSMDAILQNGEIYKIYISYRMQHLHDLEKNKTLRSGNDKLYGRIIEAGQKNKEIRSDIPSAILVANVELAFFMKTIIWVYQGETFNPEAMADMIIDLYLNGAKA